MRKSDRYSINTWTTVSNSTRIGSVLFIYDLKRSDGQTWICDVWRNGGALGQTREAKIVAAGAPIQQEPKAESISISQGEALNRNCKQTGTDYLWFNCTENDECHVINSNSHVQATYELRINAVAESDKNRYK